MRNLLMAVTRTHVVIGALAGAGIAAAAMAGAGMRPPALAWDGQAGEEPHLSGLIDPDQLDGEEQAGCDYDENRSGPAGDRAGAGRRGVGARSPAGRVPLKAVVGGGR